MGWVLSFYELKLWYYVEYYRSVTKLYHFMWEDVISKYFDMYSFIISSKIGWHTKYICKKLGIVWLKLNFEEQKSNPVIFDKF